MLILLQIDHWLPTKIIKLVTLLIFVFGAQINLRARHKTTFRLCKLQWHKNQKRWCLLLLRLWQLWLRSSWLPIAVWEARRRRKKLSGKTLCMRECRKFIRILKKRNKEEIQCLRWVKMTIIYLIFRNCIQNWKEPLLWT